MAQHHRGSRSLFLRRTFADLNKPGAAIDRSHQLLSGEAAWHGQEHRWTWSNGSILQFGHLQHAHDVYAYQGSQFDCLLWDELTQFTVDQYQFLRSRVRATVGRMRTSIRAATNPGGIGHAWVKERFIDAAPWGKGFEIISGRAKTTACFVPARVTDNTALLSRDPGYLDRLGGLPPALRRAYLEGDWDQFEGQFFPEWRRAVHVCEPFAIPGSWPRWRGVDFGFASPMCCLWVARAPDGRLYVYRELYGTGWLDMDQALRIRALSSGEQIRMTWADPSMWAAKHNGHAVKAVAQSYGEMGVPLLSANNNRAAGWQELHRALAWDEQLATRPLLQVFPSCGNLIRTLPAQVHDQADVEDLDTRGEDHAVDALRYVLMGMYGSADHPVRTSAYSIGPGVTRPRSADWNPFGA